MPTRYRAATKAEAEHAMKVWTTVFTVPREFFQTLLDSEPRRSMRQTLVAEDASGRFVASVQFLVLQIRGLDGKPKLVGGIANVSTLPEARKQGHSGALLQRAIKEMTAMGCEYSWLFTDVNPHYERYGWWTVPTTTREGKLAKKSAQPPATGYTLKLVPNYAMGPQFKALSRVYDAYNENRPLAHVRSLKCWQNAIYYRMTTPCGMTWVARPEGSKEVCAYAVAKPDKLKMSLVEACVAPGHEAAFGSLFDAVREEAAKRLLTDVNVLLPNEPAIDQALSRVAHGLKPVGHTAVMVRSLSSSTPDDYLKELFASPTGHFWVLDDF